MVMEYCPGGDLFSKLHDDYPDGMEEREASEIMMKIVKALIHCHELNIMHRDLKPENIIFGPDGEPKLTDFGFALEHKKGMTWLECVGSTHFMAPEVLYGKYGKECDVWSLGVIIFQTLTGELPFDGPTDAEVRDKIRFGQFKMPDNLSDHAKDLLREMLNYQNDKRITFKEVLRHPWFQK